MFKRLFAGVIAALLFFAMSTGTASATFAGQNGKILYTKTDNQLYIADADGSNESLFPNQAVKGGKFSPDGQTIAFAGAWPDGGASNLSLSDLNGTIYGGRNYFVDNPSWNPDGLSLYYESCYPGPACYLFKENIDGSGGKNVLNVGRGNVSPDGNQYAKVTPWQNPSSVQHIVGLQALNTSQAPLQAAYSENAYDSLWCSVWSPDSTKIATWSNAGMAYTQKTLKIVNVADGTIASQYLFDGFPYCPVWSPDGTSVIFGADKDTRLDLLGEYTDYALIKLDLQTGNQQRIKDNVTVVFDWQPITTPMLYRLANWKTHERLFTTNKEEVFAAQRNDSGWVYENVAMRIYTDAGANRSAIYRMANWKTKERLFTTDLNEVNTIKDKNGWVYEGIAFYASNSGTPVYRMANWMTSERLFTTDLNEVNHIKDKNGWVYEGIAYYAPNS